MNEVPHLKSVLDEMHDRFRRRAFEGVSTINLMRIAARNLMETSKFLDAGKLLTQIRHFEDLEAARPAKKQSASLGPGRLPPTAGAKSDRPTQWSPERLFLRGLSDRDFVRLLSALTSMALQRIDERRA